MGISKPLSVSSSLTAPGVIFLALLGLWAATGNLPTTYHFTDDHEILDLARDLRSHSWVEVAAQYSERDLQVRYRPLYYPYRVLQVVALGQDFPAWGLWNLFLAAVCFSLVWGGYRRFGFNQVESLLGVLITFLGAQMAIWWKLGPPETPGMVFLAASFFFLGGTRRRDCVWAALLLLPATLCKESFLLAVPAFVLLRWTVDRAGPERASRRGLPLLWVWLLPCGAFLGGLGFIVFGIGTDRLGYAGVGPNPGETILGILRIARSPLAPYEALLLAFSVVALFARFRWPAKKLPWGSLGPALGFVALLVGANVFLYAKSGMEERYLLPSTLGLGFLVASLVRIGAAWPSRCRAVLIGLTGVLLLLMAWRSVTAARDFALEGTQTEALLGKLVGQVPPPTVLLVADPVRRFEWSSSLKTYLSLVDQNQLYGFRMDSGRPEDEGSVLAGLWSTWFFGTELADLRDPPEYLVFFDRAEVPRFFTVSGLSCDQYESVLSEDSSFGLLHHRAPAAK